MGVPMRHNNPCETAQGECRVNGKTRAAARTCGAKPKDPQERAAQVAAAVRALEKIGAAFSVADVAERAGLSRATIYRSDALRAIVGAKGDGARTVPADLHEKLAERHQATKSKARSLRQELRELEQSWQEMRERALSAEGRLAEAERKLRLLANPINARHGNATTLAGIGSQMSADERRQARRQLARALHPDLFARDAATQALATELLKLINSLAE